MVESTRGERREKPTKLLSCLSVARRCPPLSARVSTVVFKKKEGEGEGVAGRGPSHLSLYDLKKRMEADRPLVPLHRRSLNIPKQAGWRKGGGARFTITTAIINGRRVSCCKQEG